VLKLRRAGDTVEIPLATYSGKKKRMLGPVLEVRFPNKRQGDEICEALVACTEKGSDLPLHQTTWKMLRDLGIVLRGVELDGGTEIRFDAKMSLDDPVFDSLLPLRPELSLAIASLVRIDDADLGN